MERPDHYGCVRQRRAGGRSAASGRCHDQPVRRQPCRDCRRGATLSTDVRLLSRRCQSGAVARKGNVRPWKRGRTDRPDHPRRSARLTDAPVHRPHRRSGVATRLVHPQPLGLDVGGGRRRRRRTGCARDRGSGSGSDVIRWPRRLHGLPRGQWPRRHRRPRSVRRGTNRHGGAPAEDSRSQHPGAGSRWWPRGRPTAGRRRTNERRSRDSWRAPKRRYVLVAVGRWIRSAPSARQDETRRPAVRESLPHAWRLRDAAVRSGIAEPARVSRDAQGSRRQPHRCRTARGRGQLRPSGARTRGAAELAALLG